MADHKTGGGHIPPHPRRARWLVLVVGLLLTIIATIMIIVSRPPSNPILDISVVVGVLVAFATLRIFENILNDVFDWLDRWMHQMWQWVQQKRVPITIFLLLLVIGVLLSVYVVVPLLSVKPSPSSCNPTPITGCAIVNVNSDPIGLSDGRFAFDTGLGRTDGQLKQQAAEKLSQGDRDGAKALLKQAIKQDSNDAEAQIYLNNIEIGDAPSLTFVVGVTIAPGTIGGARDTLQGADVAQRESNIHCTLQSCLKVRLLIAKAGNDPRDAATVAELIQKIAPSQHIVGVMGWNLSNYTINALGVLAQAQIPMVSPVSSSDDLTSRSPYFFRIAPTDSSQGKIGAQYLEQQQAQHVAVFEDIANPYSKSLAEAFKGQFTKDGHTIIPIPYTKDASQTIKDGLHTLPKNTDFIYFAGYALDASTLLTNLPPCTSTSCLQVMGGDGLYELSDYTQEAHAALPRVHMTAFAYHLEWKSQGLEAQQPPFFDEFTRDFAGSPPKTGYYTYDIPAADAILGYDAMQTLLKGCNLALQAGQSPQSLTGENIQSSLTEVKGAKAIQGVSGQISFDDDTGNATKKAVVVLHFDSHPQTQIDDVKGCFLKAHC